eukprot:tig00021612_g22877.t1
MSESSEEQPAKRVRIEMAVSLTPAEGKLFDLLLSVVRDRKLDTTLRVAGGWVRDKVLGRESHDLDIALDNMLGREFAEHIDRYMKEKLGKGCGVAVIQSNPDQSKHLETARVKIDGAWIDFVNLRSETYTADSRIPEMAFGTPEQDALRRDLTINALFYNVNRGEVEDFTGRGIADLREGVIRTPLPPLTTFLDDPLRVLRAARFASRFGFTVDSELSAAAGNPDVKNALMHKISRERVGVEVDGMLAGPRPAMALGLLHRMGLFAVVFSSPPGSPELIGDFDKESMGFVLKAARALQYRTKHEDAMEAEDRKMLFLAALVWNLRTFSCLDARKKPLPLVKHIIRESLKLKAKDADNVHLALECYPDFQELCRLHAKQAPLADRKKAGLAMRTAGPLWSVSLDLGAVVDLQGSYSLDAPLNTLDTSLPDNGDEAVCARYTSLRNRLHDMGLVGAWDFKHILNGQEVMAALNMKGGGPKLGILMQRIMEWQLEHPAGTKEECREWLIAAEEAAGK